MFLLDILKKPPETLRGHLDDFIADTLARCTRCGKCYEACPMTRYSEGLSNADAKQVVSGVLDWLKQTPGNAESEIGRAHV